eukprot:c14766_g1_i1 orf=72-284(-)
MICRRPHSTTRKHEESQSVNQTMLHDTGEDSLKRRQSHCFPVYIYRASSGGEPPLKAHELSLNAVHLSFL